MESSVWAESTEELTGKALSVVEDSAASKLESLTEEVTVLRKKLEEKEVELGEKQERLEKVSSFLKGL
tara:strand:- start:364 stop:567 length:204 start_codon:yes stop_codon:yes gene_type:complete